MWQPEQHSWTAKGQTNIQRLDSSTWSQPVSLWSPSYTDSHMCTYIEAAKKKLWSVGKTFEV